MRFEQVVDRFIQATAEVAPDYFLLQVAGGHPQWRERVYCYELYHQLRRNWGEDVMLAAEVDKRGHPLPHFRLAELSNVKPDFIVHEAGHEHTDIAVIEVKSVRASRAEIIADYLTLINFLHRARYHGAIMLIYGQEEGAEDRVSATAAEALTLARNEAGFECGKPLITLHHRAPGEPAIVLSEPADGAPR